MTKIYNLYAAKTYLSELVVMSHGRVACIRLLSFAHLRVSSALIRDSGGK